MSPTRTDLLQALCQIQNHPFFSNVDILTITGCGMTDDEVRAHIECQFTHIIDRNFREAQEAPRRVRNAIRIAA